MKNTRVVVTGLGLVTSIGIGKDEFWKNLTAGMSGISEVKQFDTKRFKRHFGGEIQHFNPAEYLHRKSANYIGRASQLGLTAAKLALKDASISDKAIKNQKTAVIVGVTIPESGLIDQFSEEMYFKRTKNIHKRSILNINAPSISRDIGHFLGAKPVNMLIPNACGAGNFSIAYGYDLIKQGKVQTALVGGAEAFSRVAFQGFQTLRAMAENKCSPFDKNRQGMLLGEGASILILEDYESAIARKARIYCEVLGYGYSCDAHSMTIPKKEGVFKAMKKALDNSGIKADEIDYISAHGTGTIANDKNETAAIKDLFGERFSRMPISSMKSMLGHSMGAASAIEAASCCLSIEKNVAPATMNYTTPDPDCDIDCVPNFARKTKVDAALNNGFAFGGNNCCVVFKRCA